MSQYIITEEQLIDAQLWSIKPKVAEEIRSHPYNPQAEQFALDEFMNKIVSSRFDLDDEIVVRITDIRIIREELRQEGKTVGGDK